MPSPREASGDYDARFFLHDQERARHQLSYIGMASVPIRNRWGWVCSCGSKGIELPSKPVALAEFYDHQKRQVVDA